MMEIIIKKRIEEMVKWSTRTSSSKMNLLSTINNSTLDEIVHHRYFVDESMDVHTITSADFDDPNFPENDFPDDNFNIDFHVLERIGITKTSIVHRVVSRKDNSQYAAKILTRPIDISLLPREAQVMMDIDKMEGIAHLKACYNTTHNNIPSVVIVMDTPTGIFAPYSRVKQTKTYEEKRLIISRLVRILKELDQRNIAHNDLHANNFLVSQPDNKVTLIDFGRAQYKHIPFDMIQNYRKWEMSPPELKQYGIFSYDMLTVWTIHQIVKRSFDDTNPPPPLAMDLLQAIDVQDYRDRITLQQLFKHPYLQAW